MKEIRREKALWKISRGELPGDLVKRDDGTYFIDFAITTGTDTSEITLPLYGNGFDEVFSVLGGVQINDLYKLDGGMSHKTWECYLIFKGNSKIEEKDPVLSRILRTFSETSRVTIGTITHQVVIRPDSALIPTRCRQYT